MKNWLTSGNNLRLTILLASLMIGSLVMNNYYITNENNNTETLETNEELTLKFDHQGLSLNYIDQAAMIIENNTALALAASSGDGSSGAPYIIENLNITTSGINGIYITGTTSYFVIRDSYFKTESAYGILVNDVADGTVLIENNICSQNGVGIFVNYTNSITIQHNQCNQNSIWGIYLDVTHYPTIINNTAIANGNEGLVVDGGRDAFVTNNTANYNGGDGIAVIWSPLSSNSMIINNTANNNQGDGISAHISLQGGFVIANNTVIKNYNGFWLYQNDNALVTFNYIALNQYGIDSTFSDGSKLFNNTFFHNVIGGMYIEGGDSSFIQDNVFTGDGLFIQDAVADYATYTVSNNIVNGKPYGYFIGLNNSIISTEFGQLLLINSYNVTISNQNFSESFLGIKMQDGANNVIQNNYIDNNGLHGIYISNVYNMSIIDNSITGNGGSGLYIFSAQNSKVINNNISDNGDEGIYAYDMDYTLFHNNTIDRNADDGIYFSSSPYTDVRNNTFMENLGYGVYLSSVAYTYLFNNSYANNNLGGAYLSASGYSSVLNSTFVNNGISMSDTSLTSLYKYVIANNTVNGLPLGFYFDLVDTILDQPHGQIILVNGVNVRIENQDCSNLVRGITVYHGSNNQIVNNNCSFSGTGIYIQQSHFITIQDNTLNNNTIDGIYLSGSDNAYIFNNSISYNGDDGLEIRSSDASIIFDNDIVSNGDNGLYVDYSPYANITTNTIIKNKDYGIEFYNDFSTITFNTIRENGLYGISISSSSNDNLLHNNVFYKNNNDSVQAIDNGPNNQWYLTNPNNGNIWLGYYGKGPYSIDGTAGSIDLYPLPGLAEISNLNLSSDNQYMTVNYNTFDEIVSVKVYVDNIVNSTAFPSGTQIGPLADGIHNVTIVVENVDGVIEGLTELFTIDATGPQVSLLTPSSGDIVPISTIIDLDILDNSGISEVLYNWNGNSNITLSTPYNVNFIPGSSGNQELHVYATDNYGNSVYFTATFTIEEAPTTSPPPTSSSTTSSRTLSSTTSTTTLTKTSSSTTTQSPSESSSLSSKGDSDAGFISFLSLIVVIPVITTLVLLRRHHQKL